MIPRLGALLFLSILFVAGAWYVLRDTPEKKVFRLREEARSLLRNAADLERADELNEEILKLIPGSLYDLLFKAELNELRRTATGLREALRIHDEILARGDPSYLGVAFYKARVCRALGLMADARAALLSVMDQYPYLALMELGETSMASVAPLDALRWFRRAGEVAVTGAEGARAREAEAGVYRLVLAMSSTARKTDGDERIESSPERDQTAGDLRDKARASLTAALDFIRSPETPSSAREARRWLLWAASLSEQLISVSRPEDTPCQDGVVLLEGKLKAYAPIMKEENAAVRMGLGTLRLLAVRHEAHHLPSGQEEYRRLAEKDFLTALGKTPEEGRALVARVRFPLGTGSEARALTLEGEETLRYLQTLSGVSRVYLAIGDSRRLLDDRSDLALSRRLSDVIEVADREVGGVFAMFLGIARLEGREPAEAQRQFERYMTSLAADRRPEAALDVAEQLLRHAPGQPLVLHFMDLFRTEGGRPLEFVGRRVALLVTARAQDRLRDGASTRLDGLLLEAAAEARSALEVTSLARVFVSVKGLDAALGFLRAARPQNPRDFDVSWLLAELLLEKARAAEEMDGGGEEIHYREALAVCLSLFVSAPARSQEVIRATAESARKLLARGSERITAEMLRPFFPGTTDAQLAALSPVLENYLLGKYGQALDRASVVPDPRTLIPFLPFIRGSCHVGLAGHLRRDRAQARSDVAREALESRRADHVRQAMAEFRTGLDFVANRLELHILELEELPPGGDVPDDLLGRIRELSDAEDAGHRGYFLLARALRRRLEHRYHDPNVKNSEIARLVQGEQRALRSSIRRYPYFNPSYRALAETFLLSEREIPARNRTQLHRQLFSPDLKKAIDVLKAAPEPDDEIISALATRLGESGRDAEATPYLERLAMLSPGGDVFRRLIENYISTGNVAARAFLQEGPPREDPGTSPERARTVHDLARVFETVPEHRGIRLSFVANLKALEERKASGEEKSRLRRACIEHYTSAVKAYDEQGVQPPAVLLNNLAWYLAEDEESSLRVRALEVAARGKALVPSAMSMPNMHDTHAWALYRNGNLTGAVTALRELIRLVDQPTFRYHLARVLLDLRKYDEALDEILKARGSVADFPESQEALRLESEIREARRKAIGE
jgi:tetratricopeptide (TPR) repeat protein